MCSRIAAESCDTQSAYAWMGALLQGQEEKDEGEHTVGTCTCCTFSQQPRMCGRKKQQPPLHRWQPLSRPLRAPRPLLARPAPWLA